VAEGENHPTPKVTEGKIFSTPKTVEGKNHRTPKVAVSKELSNAKANVNNQKGLLLNFLDAFFKEDRSFHSWRNVYNEFCLEERRKDRSVELMSFDLFKQIQK
jgi:hypothetical protein